MSIPKAFALTPRAQMVLSYSHTVAFKTKHEYVLPEHILLALLKIGDGSANNVLTHRGIPTKLLIQKVEEFLPDGNRMAAQKNIPLAHESLDLFNLGEKIHKELDHAYYGTEHLLLALLQQGGTPSDILHAFGLRKDELTLAVLQELDPTYRPKKKLRKITLTTQGYREEIDSLQILRNAKAILKELIYEYFSSSKPAKINKEEKKAIRDSGIRCLEIIHPSQNRSSGTLTIMQFTPDNPKKDYEYLYLVRHRPNGKSQIFR